MELKDNTVIVVLGASGDLAKKKTVSQLILLSHVAMFIMLIICSSRPCSVW